MNPEILAARRQRLAAALPLGDAIMLVHAGEPVPLPEGSDQTYPYRAHSEYVYAAGEECAGGVVAFDPRDGAAGDRLGENPRGFPRAWTTVGYPFTPCAFIGSAVSSSFFFSARSASSPRRLTLPRPPLWCRRGSTVPNARRR